MSGEKSQNPFKYGDELLSPDGSKFKVNAVTGDMVSVYRVVTGDVEWSTFKWILDHNWRKVPPRKWEDLTAENWRERRDMGVWCKDSVQTKGPFKLIDFTPKKLYPFILLDRDESPVVYSKCSIYNDAGEEARWEE